MQQFLSRIKPYQKLSELEEIFYTIYQQNSVQEKYESYQYYSEHIQDSSTRRMFHGILSLSNTPPIIPEDAFFEDNQTIFINLHPRYMPVFEHTHDFFELQFLLSGQLKQSIGGFNITLNPGDICFISPTACHTPEVSDPDTLIVNILLRSKTLRTTFSNCLIEDDEIASFFMRILSGQTYHPYLLWHTNKDLRIFNLILDMLDSQKNPDKYTDRLLHTMVEQLFIYLLRDHSDDFTTGTFQKKNDENIISILKYAQANYATITLASLAEHFNYNEAYLSRTLKSYLGCSFSKYFIDVRLKKAVQLLTATHAPITDILLQVGYTDKTHFYRSFQKKYGMTPNQYRNSHTKNNTEFHQN